MKKVSTALIAPAIVVCLLFGGCSQVAADAVTELVSSSVEQVLAENPDSESVASEADSLVSILEEASENSRGGGHAPGEVSKADALSSVDKHLPPRNYSN